MLTQQGRSRATHLLPLDQGAGDAALRAVVALVAGTNESAVSRLVPFDVLHCEPAGGQSLDSSGECQCVQLTKERLEGLQSGQIQDHARG